MTFKDKISSGEKTASRGGREKGKSKLSKKPSATRKTSSRKERNLHEKKDFSGITKNYDGGSGGGPGRGDDENHLQNL